MTGELSTHVLQIVKQFEDAWQHEGPPDIDRFLPSDQAQRRAVLIALVQVDFERRFKAGQAPRVQEYLERYPELAADPQAVLALGGTQATLDPCPTVEESLSKGEKPDRAATWSARPASDLPPRQIGRYVLLERIGAGGMGSVYKARDPSLERVVALKLPHFERSDNREAEQRFLREARAAALIRHPRVCPIYDVGEDGGTSYIVMAYLEGQSLATRLSVQARIEDLNEAVDLVCQVADGLSAIHSHGIIHRDLKPGNILFDKEGTGCPHRFRPGPAPDRRGKHHRGRSLAGNPRLHGPGAGGR
jgi:hypothetical protein